MNESLVNLVTLLEGAFFPILYSSSFLLGLILALLGKPKMLLLCGVFSASILALGAGIREYYECFIEPCEKFLIANGGEDCAAVQIDSIRCVSNICLAVITWFFIILLVYLPIPYFIAVRLKRKS